jgi:DNA adenine methylase
MEHQDTLFDGPITPISTRRNSRKLIAFGWYGGKFSHLEWLLPLLPECHHYCEPFAGSAAVLLNREPSPLETYNDVDGAVVNFFRVLREKPAELTKAIGLTPFSREELAVAVSATGSGISDVERARPFTFALDKPEQGLLRQPL